jgi:hypothetical protein
MKAIRFEAVAAGVMTNVAGSICVGVLLSLILGIAEGTGAGIWREQSARLPAPHIIGLLGLAGRLAFAWLGGYIAARMAKSEGLASSHALGLILIPLGAILAFAVPGAPSAWNIMAGLILTLPAARSGGEWAMARATSHRNYFA